MLENGSKQIVNKLWSYCDLLRDEGLSYGQYVDQLTYLLFLKMAHERTQPPYGSKPVVRPPHDWATLASKEGAELEDHYRRTLETLAKQGGMLGAIFRKSQNHVTNPAMLRRLVVDLIGREQWTGLTADVKGDAYEGLLEKNAQESKKGAGQYFTPRPVIWAMVQVMQPTPRDKICDPACGTGGFLIAAHEYILHAFPNQNPYEKGQVRLHAFRGNDIVDDNVRRATMNLYLHSIGPRPDEDDKPLYDLRTNMHFTLVQNRLADPDLKEFVEQYKPGDRPSRVATWNPETPTGRWRKYTHDEILQRDKCSLDIFWLRDESLDDPNNLPPPEVIAAEIVEDLETALDEIRLIASDLARARL